MNLDEAYEYVERARESESELRAEYGSGAVSLGYDPYDWAPAYDGYRTSDDETYAEAVAIIEAARAERALVNVVRWAPADMSWQALPFGRWECIRWSSNDIPF